MPSYKRPGVYVEESLRLNLAVSTPGISDGAFVGPTWRGPATPTLVTSWSAFTKEFGGFAPDAARFSYLPFAVYNFFSNGGRACWILRVLGTGGLEADRTYIDTAATPQSTLKLTAKNVGTWGNNLYVTLVSVPPETGTDRFSIIVREGGTSDQYTVERHTDMSMDAGDPRYVETIVNSPITGSAYIVAEDLESASAAPLNTPNTGVGTLALTGGLDGSAVTGSQIAAAVPSMDLVEGPFGLNLPGDNTTATNAAISYAENRGDVFVVADPPSGLPVSSAISYAQSLPESPYGAVYYPWVSVPDPSTTTPGAVRLLPPGGFMLGLFTRTDHSRGVHKAPAGLDTRLAGAIGIENKLSNTDLDDLNDSNVNAIRHITGAGVCCMGARTLKLSQGDRYVPVRRTLIYIKTALVSGTRWAIFEPNDQTLWSGITIAVTQFMLDLWKRGGLRGATPAAAFYVKCDEELNTSDVIAAGEVRLEVGVALQFPAEFVVIRIGQWEGGQTVAELRP